MQGAKLGSLPTGCGRRNRKPLGCVRQVDGTLQIELGVVAKACHIVGVAIAGAGDGELAAITRLAFDIIPQDPARSEYRQGNTLGNQHKHWFRTKFFQQYRLFFRYHAPSKVLVLAWVNDDDTKRAYESSDDAYQAFRKMLGAGNPPDDWAELLEKVRA